MCTYTSYMVLILPFVVYIVEPCNAARVCGLAYFSGHGWMTIYLKKTCGFIRHGDSRSNTLCLVRQVAVWSMFLDVMITYDRSIDARNAFMQEVAVSFSNPRVRPARRRHDKYPPAGSCQFEKGESTGQIRGFDPRVSQKQPAGHGGLTRE